MVPCGSYLASRPRMSLFHFAPARPAFAGSLLFRSASGILSPPPASPKKEFLSLRSIILRGFFNGGQRYRSPLPARAAPLPSGACFADPCCSCLAARRRISLLQSAPLSRPSQARFLFRSASGNFSPAPASPKKNNLSLCSILLRGLLNGGQWYAHRCRHGLLPLRFRDSFVVPCGSFLASRPRMSLFHFALASRPSQARFSPLRFDPWLLRRTRSWYFSPAPSSPQKSTFRFSRFSHPRAGLLIACGCDRQLRHLRMIEQSAIHVYAKMAHGQPSFVK